MQPAPDQVLDHRHERERLADARPVQPGEAAMRALPPRDAAPLAEALPILLTAAHAPQKDRGGDRLERDEAAAIEAQRQRQPRPHAARSACAALSAAPGSVVPTSA